MATCFLLRTLGDLVYCKLVYLTNLLLCQLYTFCCTKPWGWVGEIAHGGSTSVLTFQKLIKVFHTCGIIVISSLQKKKNWKKLCLVMTHECFFFGWYGNVKPLCNVSWWKKHQSVMTYVDWTISWFQREGLWVVVSTWPSWIRFACPSTLPATRHRAVGSLTSLWRAKKYKHEEREYCSNV